MMGAPTRAACRACEHFPALEHMHASLPSVFAQCRCTCRYAHFEDVLKLGFKEWNPKDGVNAGEWWVHNYPAYVRLKPSRKEKQDHARWNQGEKSKGGGRVTLRGSGEGWATALKGRL